MATRSLLFRPGSPGLSACSGMLRQLLAPALAVCLALSLCACGAKPHYRGGVPGSAPYTVRGKRYVPLKSAEGFVQEGVASWYGTKFHGRPTSSGETYNQWGMTAAHTILPLNVKVRVTNLDNGRTCIVRINDRGPFVDDRVIDLSRAAAQKVGILGTGTGRVLIQALTERRQEPKPKQEPGPEATPKPVDPAVRPAPAEHVSAAPAPAPVPLLAAPAEQAMAQEHVREGGYGLAADQAHPRGGASGLPSKGGYGLPAEGGGSYAGRVQAGAFSSQHNAERCVQALKREGLPCIVSRTPSGLWKVEAGPFADEAARDRAFARVKRLFPGSFTVD